MAKVTKDQDGLSPAESRFAVCLAQGMSQVDAHRTTWPKSRVTPKSRYELASKLANKLEVKARVQELLRAMKITDLDSQAKAYADLLTGVDAAMNSKNWTAFASLQRLRLDCHGMLKSNGAGSALSSISDETLLEKLAGANAELRRQLTTLLGTPTFQKPDDEQPSPSKH